MPWELTVWGPNGGLRALITNETHRNPVMSVEASVDAGGGTNSINIRGRNVGMSVLPRSIIDYSAWRELIITVDDQIVTFEDQDLYIRDLYEPLAAGVVVTSPGATSPGAGPIDRDADAIERVTAVGLDHLLHERIVRPRVWEGDIDVATIAYELCLAFAHPMLLVTQANFPPTGHSLGLFYTPEKTVAAALDDLESTLPMGGRWHVDAKRAIHFQAGT